MSTPLFRRIARLTLAALIIAPAPLALPGAAHARIGCGGPAGNPAPAQRGWALDRLAPETAWPLSRGAGVTVAVIDSGVNGDHKVLKGQVLAGRDFSLPDFDGQCDTLGHGTVIAGIIAGKEVSGVAFTGIAPDAKILPLRVLDSDKPSTDPSAPGRIAQAITYAVDQGADVINLSLETDPVDSLNAAIAYAEEKNVVVVAAGGNQAPDETRNGGVFPAAYKTVLAVAGVDEQGGHVATSVQGPYVDLSAPGLDLFGPAPTGDGFVGEEAGGTSFAAAYVSGAAALVRSYFPTMTAADVRARLMATADQPPTGQDNSFGTGMVNPYLALSTVFTTKSERPAEPIALAAKPADPTATARLVAWWAIGIVLVLTVATLAGAPLIRRGRRNGWRPNHGNI
ncbi:type VII secretion-associated serine protease mycosin [Catenuloplanes sp. NPDC051500]|uniref:type VII secretion-associated serine protease mycosin n=1 Tax=Catenuloplanes sp. NPDC051500 TaxID=3363959 RepID=UPI0037AE55D4